MTLSKYLQEFSNISPKIDISIQVEKWLYNKNHKTVDQSNNPQQQNRFPNRDDIEYKYQQKHKQFTV